MSDNTDLSAQVKELLSDSIPTTDTFEQMCRMLPGDWDVDQAIDFLSPLLADELQADDAGRAEQFCRDHLAAVDRSWRGSRFIG